LTYLKLSKAAKILDVHRDTIRRYIRNGILDAKLLPTGHWRVSEESVQSLLDTPVLSKADEILSSL